MSARRQAASTALHRCLRALEEGVKGYRTAHAQATSPRLRGLFDLHRAERAAFARVLLRIATDASIAIDVDIHKTKGFVEHADDDDRALLVACMRADAAAVAAFDHALIESEQSILDEGARAMIRFQRVAIATSLTGLMSALQAA